MLGHRSRPHMRSLISPCKTAGVRCFENSRLRLSLPWRSSSLQFVAVPYIFCNAAQAHHYSLNTGSSSSQKIFATQIFFGNLGIKGIAASSVAPIQRKMCCLKVQSNLKRVDCAQEQGKARRACQPRAPAKKCFCGKRRYLRSRSGVT